mmetsp:Transcript_34903/g.68937  ORF Transcript_34903/g.68937 Transcript_34903/m.68937 type:complete len:87 (+) Transcript_34903:372-632(+)
MQLSRPWLVNQIGCQQAYQDKRKWIKAHVQPPGIRAGVNVREEVFHAELMDRLMEDEDRPAQQSWPGHPPPSHQSVKGVREVPCSN